MELVFTLCIPEAGFKIVDWSDNIIKHIDDLEPLCIVLDLNGGAVNGCKMITKIRDILNSFLITMAYPSDETLIIKALDREVISILISPYARWSLLPVVKRTLRKLMIST